MQDTARHSAPQHDIDGHRHTMSISLVAAELEAAGVPRSHRHIIRLCKSGALDAGKYPGATGDEWFVALNSVPKVIGDLRALDEARARRSAPQHDTSNHVVASVEPKVENDAARYGALQHDAPGQQGSQKTSETQSDTARQGSATEPAMSNYVALLERDNEFLREQVTKKDEQITDLSKRFGETQTLLGAMQRMLAPLLGQADPFNTRDKREASDGPRV